jgi:hypothetical protein
MRASSGIFMEILLMVGKNPALAGLLAAWHWQTFRVVTVGVAMRRDWATVQTLY